MLMNCEGIVMRRGLSWAGSDVESYESKRIVLDNISLIIYDKITIDLIKSKVYIFDRLENFTN